MLKYVYRSSLGKVAADTDTHKNNERNWACE
jgi:hypothetical protein